MQLYGFHNETGELLGVETPERDPLDPSRILAPAFTTSVAPPAFGDGQRPVFIGGAWSVVADHRGEVWYRGREPVLIETLGEPVDGLTPELAPLPIEEQWAAMRAQRDARLAASDWTQMVDVPLTSPTVDAWRAYRQALRDLPGLTADPSAPEWPEKP